jgi:hypothetical protein
MNWDKAACKGVTKKLGYDPFYPDIVDEDGEEYFDDGTIWAAYGDTSVHYDEAKSYCDVCPLKDECLDHALREKERYGMWGGTTPIERRRVERRERRKRLQDKRANEQ